MTPEIVTTIFEGLEEWERTGHFTIGRCIIVPGSPIIVPVSRADIIRENCSHKGIRKKAAQYYININPFSNWGDLAEMLYTAREERAINIFKAHLPIPKGNHCDCLLSVCVQPVVTVCTMRGLFPI